MSIKVARAGEKVLQNEEKSFIEPETDMYPAAYELQYAPWWAWTRISAVLSCCTCSSGSESAFIGTSWGPFGGQNNDL